MELEKLIWFERPHGEEYMDAQSCFEAWPMLHMYYADELVKEGQ